MLWTCKKGWKTNNFDLDIILESNGRHFARSYLCLLIHSAQLLSTDFTALCWPNLAWPFGIPISVCYNYNPQFQFTKLKLWQRRSFILEELQTECDIPYQIAQIQNNQRLEIVFIPPCNHGRSDYLLDSVNQFRSATRSGSQHFLNRDLLSMRHDLHLVAVRNSLAYAQQTHTLISFIQNTSICV